MKIVGLVSGGKDSIFNLLHCIANNHELIALANLKSTDEIDSYMFQSVGAGLIDLYAECLDVPIHKRHITGKSLERGKVYIENKEDEVEDLVALLQEVLLAHPDVKGVAVGAILSNYQRIRVENVCSRLKLTPLTYLWRRNQSDLLDEMIQFNMNSVLIKVASIGLEVNHLGKTLSEMRDHLHKINRLYKVHICGEGGEYETMTLDCPLFKRRIVIDETKVVLHSDDAFAPVAYLEILKAHTEGKKDWVDVSDAIKYQLTYLNRVSDDLVVRDHNKPYSKVEHDHIETSTKPPYNLKTTSSSLSLTSLTSSQSSIQLQLSEIFNIIFDVVTTNSYVVTDIALMTVYVHDISKFAMLNEIYKEFFHFVNPPSRVTVEIASVDGVMVDCLAVKGDRESMHVQGISYWAPANIGPYSQATRVNDQIYYAGQIGLIPGTMTLPESLDEQTYFSLKHLSALTTAMGNDVKTNLVYCICFVTRIEDIGYAKSQWKRFFGNDKIPFSVVVCTGLPIGAKIEWQIVCGSKEYLQSMDLEQESFDFEDTCIVEGLTSKINLSRRGSITGLFMKLAMRNEESVNISCLQKIINTQLKSLFSVYSSLDLNMVVFCKVFYNQNMINYELIRNACAGFEFGCAFIPVDGIDDGCFALFSLQFAK